MNLISLLYQNIIFFIGVILYRVLLDWNYFNIVSPAFLYYGFEDHRNLDNLYLSCVILLLSFLLVRRIFAFKDNRPSALIVFLLYLISFVPFTTCIYAGILSTGMICYFCLYWCILIIAQRISLNLKLTRISKFKFANFVVNDKFIKYVGFFSVFLIISLSAIYTGLRLNFDFSLVYDLRHEAKEYDMPTAIRYLFSWTRAINPVLLSYCLIKKKKALAGLFFLTQMLSFSFDGMKSVFFITFLVIFIYYSFDNNLSSKSLKRIILFGFVFLVFISNIEHLLLDTHFLSGMVTRRVLFTPIGLHECYYDYFSTHVPDYFRSSFLRHFGFISPYTEFSRGISYLIGAVYFNRPLMNCNNGLFSDAFANLGIVGLFVFPVFIVYILHLVDKSAFGLDGRLILASVLFLSFSLNNSSIFTVLMTHGMLVIIVLLTCMNPESYR